MKYVVLLRGINVGNLVKIPMKKLKTLLEEIGLRNVVTYLNSGNAIFESSLPAVKLTNLIGKRLEKEFGQKISILIKTSMDMVNIAKSIPNHWKNDETQQTYIAYLFSDIANPELINELPIKKQYMEIKYAHDAVIWNIKKENYNKSQITKIAGHSSYSKMTTRNANTARKLAEMCND
jgi:uncharacterized protein (DUF1697 family)